MSYSFTQIEKDKSRTITAAFCFLGFVYVATFLIIALLINNFGFFQSRLESQYLSYTRVGFQWLDWLACVKIIFVALLIAGAHWFLASMGLVERINKIFSSHPPDLNNSDEKMFQNIVEEVSVATGGTQIQPMIIPSMMLNACAYADGQSVPVIAITKGLLAKLTRSQIEAVVGHEAAHVVSEDCQNTTVISAMFEIFGAILLSGRTIAEGMLVGGHRNRTYTSGWNLNPSYSSRGASRSDRSASVLIFVLIAIAIFVIIWLVTNLARLMRMFISRQREYRADAIAVKLTRDPLSLAEALYIISSRRHSLYEGDDSLQSLFFVNPAESILNDQVNYVADLFSTHPPVKERINILLAMAHSDDGVLNQALKQVNAKEEQELQERQKVFGQAHGGMWYVQTPAANWSGPHNLDAMMGFEWLTSQTKVRKMGENTIMPLTQIEGYMNTYRKNLANHPVLACPSCGGTLAETLYEHAKVLVCQQCQGILIKEDVVSVILQRKEKVFDSRIQDMAKILLNEKPLAIKDSTLSYESQRMYRCELCRNNPKKMRRRIFNRYYPIEIDKCNQCGLVWFDKDELDVMQCMYEMRNHMVGARPQKI